MFLFNAIYWLQKKNYGRNIELLNYLDNLDNKVIFKNVKCTYNSFGSLEWENSDIYFLDDCIIIKRVFKLSVINKLIQSRQRTYILSKKQDCKIPLNLVWNYVKIDSTKIFVNGGINIKGFVSNDPAIITDLGFRKRQEILISFDINKNRQELTEIFISKHIDINDWC
jgi:hypothetical protein